MKTLIAPEATIAAPTAAAYVAIEDSRHSNGNGQHGQMDTSHPQPSGTFYDYEKQAPELLGDGRVLNKQADKDSAEQAGIRMNAAIDAHKQAELQGNFTASVNTALQARDAFDELARLEGFNPDEYKRYKGWLLDELGFSISEPLPEPQEQAAGTLDRVTGVMSRAKDRLQALYARAGATVTGALMGAGNRAKEFFNGPEGKKHRIIAGVAGAVAVAASGYVIYKQYTTADSVNEADPRRRWLDIQRDAGPTPPVAGAELGGDPAVFGQPPAPDAIAPPTELPLNFNVDHSFTDEIMEYTQNKGQEVSREKSYKVYKALDKLFDGRIIDGIDTYRLPNGDLGVSNPGTGNWAPGVREALDELVKN